jgi:formate-dependent nitrite reductase membrane component NrfD
MESTMSNKVGEFFWAVVVVLGIGALHYFGGTLAFRFSDPTWRKRYLPLVAFLIGTAGISRSVLHLMQRSGASNRAFGLGFFIWLGFMAANAGVQFLRQREHEW